MNEDVVFQKYDRNFTLKRAGVTSYRGTLDKFALIFIFLAHFYFTVNIINCKLIPTVEFSRDEFYIFLLC